MWQQSIKEHDKPVVLLSGEKHSTRGMRTTQVKGSVHAPTCVTLCWYCYACMLTKPDGVALCVRNCTWCVAPDCEDFQCHGSPADGRLMQPFFLVLTLLAHEAHSQCVRVCST
jgi:hypothetical protein